MTNLKIPSIFRTHAQNVCIRLHSLEDLHAVVQSVEIKYVKYSRTSSASSTHRWVQVIPGLTIFKGVHMYFMFTMDTTFLSIKVAKCT